MMLADFHVHTIFSDGKMSVPDVVDLYGRLGFGAIAITDHVCEERSLIGRVAGILDCTLTRANFPLYLEILKSEAERAWSQYRMVLIPGIELSKNYVSNQRSAHLLGIGINNWVSADPDAVDICRAIRAQGALAVAAHPVFTRISEKQSFHLWDRREELTKEFDAWEVASGPHLFTEVLHSGLPMLASSDLHVERQLRSWKTVLECERHPEAILAAIKRQELTFHFFEPDANCAVRC